MTKTPRSKVRYLHFREPKHFLLFNFYLTLHLAGKKILITRAAHQADEFAQLVVRDGGTAVLFPTIEILPPVSWDDCDRAIDALYMYDGLIFTSANGVHGFMDRLKELRILPETLKSKMISVVGERTKLAVGEYGLSVSLMPDRFTSADLAKALDRQDLTGKAFLFPRGNLGKDILQDNLKLLGANVDSVIVYQTTKPRDEKTHEARESLLSGSIDVATFTSPSTFQNFTALFTTNELQAIFSRTAIAVIGPATAQAVMEDGFEADIVAKESTVESLVDAIGHFINAKFPP